MEHAITGYHPDVEGDWVAELACGHNQHVRHRPPFQVRPWVLSEEGRAGRLGAPLDCPLCDRAELPDEGGDPACWAGLVCPDCGSFARDGDHRPDCPRSSC